MNTPKAQENDMLMEGGSPSANPEGRTPMGIPVEAIEDNPAADPTGDRFATEVASLRIERDEQRTGGNS